MGMVFSWKILYGLVEDVELNTQKYKTLASPVFVYSVKEEGK